ncbi:MAG: HTH domain-containing protein [Negativicutes bacterium]|nr:HTH domain-containing protein [Negativicutes bacterium]
MDAKERRTALCTILKETEQPVTGTELAKMLGVSRQVIVGDIALLRAGGVHVYATPQG